jgi:plastocyanin
MKGIFSDHRKYLLVSVLIVALLVTAACSSTPAPTTIATTTPAPAPAPTSTTTPTPGQSVTINLIAQGMSFDKSTITVPAGAAVTLNFNNKDSAPHNFALYTNSGAGTPIFRGQTISATTVIYTFTAPTTPGSYFFRCDVHPTSMTGTFIVQ